MSQPPRVSDIESQRTAMKRLGFLVGKWAGEARILRGDGEAVELLQSEESEYKLDELVLKIEGIGSNKSTGKAALQELGIVSSTLGDITTNSTLRIDEIRNWAELHEITIGSQPMRKFMELKVSRRK